MEYNIKRCNLEGNELEDYGNMSFTELKNFCEEHYLGEDISEYGIVFTKKEDLNNALIKIKNGSTDTWLLGKNPESGEGEEVILGPAPIEEVEENAE